MEIENIPVLRYLKDPAQTMNELMQRYPDGGEYGWHAFVFENKTFAWWNHNATTPKWELIIPAYFETIDPNNLSAGSTYIWDSEKKLFTTVNLNLWGTEEF